MPFTSPNHGGMYAKMPDYPHVVVIKMHDWDQKQRYKFRHAFDQWRECDEGERTRGLYMTRTLAYKAMQPVEMEYRFTDQNAAFDFKLRFA